MLVEVAWEVPWALWSPEATEMAEEEVSVLERAFPPTTVSGVLTMVT